MKHGEKQECIEQTVMEPARLAIFVEYQEESVVSCTIIDKKTVTLTLLASDEGQGSSEHTAPYDAFVHFLDGEAEVTIFGKVVAVKEGEMVVMPANHPHALKAPKKVQDDLGNDRILKEKEERKSIG